MIQRISSKYLPTIDLEIEQKADGLYYIVVKMEGKPDHASMAYETLKDAEEGLRRAKKDLQVHGKEMYEDYRKHWPIKHLTKEEIQDYIMQLDPLRASNFLEGVTTLTYLSFMLSYQFDETEGLWDASIPKVLRTRLTKAVEAVDKLLDALRCSHMLGEDDKGYETLSSDSYRFLDVVNAMCNFCRPAKNEEFRLVAIENALQRALPTETAEQIRKERARGLLQIIREDLTSRHSVVGENA